MNTKCKRDGERKQERDKGSGKKRETEADR